MLLQSPIWLVLLAPWGVLAVWLLRGRPQTHSVPFLDLWGAESIQNLSPRRNWRRPPLALAFLLAAMLVSIFAAAGPMWRGGEQRSAAAPAVSDVQIRSVTVRDVPTTQAMVGIFNQSEQAAGVLTLRAGGAVVSQHIRLPARDAAENYFVDLPVSASTVDAEVVAGNIDRHLESNALGHWPKVEARGFLPPELVRMIGVYSKHRAAGGGSKSIIVAMGSSISSDEPEAVEMRTAASAAKVLWSDAVVVRDSPLSRSIDWKAVLAGAEIEPPQGGDWRPIVSVGGTAVLAARDEPVRQVWVGFSSEDFPKRVDYVVLWTQIFDWLGAVDESPAAGEASVPIENLSPVRRTDNARPLAGATFLAALGLAALACVSWKTGQGSVGKG